MIMNQDVGTRKAEVLNSLIINTTAKANDTTDILQRFDNKMSVVSFALAVVFITGCGCLSDYS